LEATRSTGAVDTYVLKLGFGYYPDWPPSAQFVNPITGKYEFPADLASLPFIEGNQEIHVHPNYPPVVQLICASVTLEFYLIRHQVNPEHLWDPDKQTFASTINAIKFGLRLPYYKGRQGTSA
jgi:hypothetical protein